MIKSLLIFAVVEIVVPHVTIVPHVVVKPIAPHIVEPIAPQMKVVPSISEPIIRSPVITPIDPPPTPSYDLDEEADHCKWTGWFTYTCDGYLTRGR